jgi:hypothetical protein
MWDVVVVYRLFLPSQNLSSIIVIDCICLYLTRLVLPHCPNPCSKVVWCDVQNAGRV